MVTLCAVFTGLCKIQHSLLKLDSTEQPIFIAINNLLTPETQQQSVQQNKALKCCLGSSPRAPTQLYL